MQKQIKLTDSELRMELNARFEQNHQMLKEMEDLNEKLIKSEMIKSHFLSNVKNEMNNPLSAILGLSHGILNKINDEEFITNSSNLIYEEAFSLNFQLKNFFCAAEIEAGQAIHEIYNVDVAQLIKSVCESYQFLADKKNVKLILEIQKDINFKTDSQKVSTILLNLLSNAIKFSHDGGDVKISALIDSEGKLNIKVQDFGIGIDKNQEKEIFDRFRQLEDGTTKQFSGHGLGLSIVNSLVELLGGTIDSDCELNYGCKFLISIPEEKNNTHEFSHSENSFLFFDEESNDEIF